LVDALIEIDNVAANLQAVTQQIVFLKAEAEALKPQTRKVDGVVQLTFRDDDHKEAHTENRDFLAEAKDEAIVLESAYKDYAKDKTAAAKTKKAVEKKKECGALSQEVRQRTESMLEEACKTLRSAYHGGDFEGNHCRKLMRQADSVMDSIQELLLGMPEADRAVGCDDDEVQKHCGAFKRLFQHMDGAIHCCNQPFGTLTNSDMADVRVLIDKLDCLWREMFETVPPKAHAWQHLVDDLERFRGLKHHQESKTEVSHQIGRRIDLIFRSANDIDKKIDCSMRHQCMAEKASMKEIQAKAKTSRSRKRTASVVDEEDNDRHTKLLLLLAMDDIIDNFPTLTQLGIASRKRQLELEVHFNNVNNNTEDAA